MKAENIFGLIAYKSDSDDYCRGCHMASYRGDFILERELSRDDLIQRLADVLWTNGHLDTSETGYETIEIMKGERPVDQDEQFGFVIRYEWLDKDSADFQGVLAQAQEKVKRRQEAEEDAQREQHQRKQAEEQAKQDAKDRQEYDRLKARFG